MWFASLKQTQKFNTGKTVLNLRLGIVFIFFVVASCKNPQEEIYFSSRTIGPSTNIYSLDFSKGKNGEIKKITDDNAWIDAEASLSNKGDIVFMSNRKPEKKIDLNKRSEDYNIFKIDHESKEIQQISASPELEHSPKISQDGSKIIYIQKSGKFRKLMLLKNGETTASSLIIADDIYSASWSSDNKTLSISCLSGNNSILYLLDLDTGDKTKLLEIAFQPVSPENQGSYTLDAIYNSNLSDELKFDGRVIASSQWSPDGEKIAYILAAATKRGRELHTLNLKSGKDSLISRPGVEVQHPISWASDSASVLYSGLVDYKYYFDETDYKKVYEGSMQIFLAKLGGDIKQLTEGNHLYNRPTFSPDNNKIAYIYAPGLGDRTLELHTMSIEGKDRRVHYDNVAGSSYLYWR